MTLKACWNTVLYTGLYTSARHQQKPAVRLASTLPNKSQLCALLGLSMHVAYSGLPGTGN